MSRCRISLIYIAAGGFSALLLGLFVFAGSVTRLTAVPAKPADAIVVLTGGSDRRIEVGLKLFRNGWGRRILISGVNRKIRPEDLLGHHLLENRTSIDLGYDALDTIGNASETSRWATRHNFKRLIVVTSSYHMPRSLNELALAMPGVEFVAYSIRPRIFSEGPWWLRPAAAKMLIAEYVKLIPSYARSVAHRILARAAIGPPAAPPRTIEHAAGQ